MNILYLCDEYPPGQHGGIGRSVQLLAREMVKQGHKVVVAGLYSLGYGGDDEFEDKGVKVYRLRFGLDAKWFKNQESLLVRISNRILNYSGLREWDIKRSLLLYEKKLEKIITDHRIDIIEMPDYNDYMRFCKSFTPFPILSAPTIVKMHGSITYFAMEANKQVPGHILKMEQVILNQAVAVSSVSGYTAGKCSLYFSYPKEIEVLYNGIDTAISATDIPKNPRQVIFTGSLVFKKGIYQLAKAWNIVNKSMPDARLLILGKGSRHKVNSYLMDEVKNSVVFMGNIETKKLYGYLSASAIGVFPSYSEAFALAPLEAIACGAAVINTNRTSGPELIDDQINGLLVDPDDVDKIASSILYLLNNSEVCVTLSKNADKKVREHFGIDKIAAKNVGFYNKVLKAIGNKKVGKE